MFGLFLAWAIINDVIMNIHVHFLNFQITFFWGHTAWHVVSSSIRDQTHAPGIGSVES